jgi:hypothetical protein
LCSTTPNRNTSHAEEQSSELAVDDSNDKQHQNGNDGNRDDAVRGHSTSNFVSISLAEIKRASIYTPYQLE